ncbi:MAG: ribonuclease HII [Nitrospirota bacterium]|nr:ribonuclease HII [Nitrospirota bacterium]
MPRDSVRPSAHQAGAESPFDLNCDPLSFERAVRASGALRIAGLDEAGRGPLAGPVVAAAVVLPEGCLIDGVNDSKKLTERQRERLYDVIRAKAVAHGIGLVDERTIDEINILQAALLAMERAVAAIVPPPDYLLIDGNCVLKRLTIPQKAIIKGDSLSHSIAAASILAKVTRDRMMNELHERFPAYNFRKHKGYGTAEHLASIREHGPCEAHRRSFRPISSMLLVKHEPSKQTAG